jgi:hypothetical protein
MPLTVDSRPFRSRRVTVSTGFQYSKRLCAALKRRLYPEVLKLIGCRVQNTLGNKVLRPNSKFELQTDPGFSIHKAVRQ